MDNWLKTLIAVLLVVQGFTITSLFAVESHLMAITADLKEVFSKLGLLEDEK